MVTEPMTVPEHGSPDTPTEGTQRRWRWSWLVSLSAVALLVVAGVAVVMTADDDDAVSSDDVAAAIAVVTAHTEAQNAADGEMMRSTLTDDATWLDNASSPMTLERYIGVVEGYGPIEQTFTGEPTVVRDPTGSGDLQVSVPMHFDSGQRSWNSTSVYTLRKVDGEWKIAQINR
jgi:ketosteroid isomerase-like protein